MSCEDLVRLGCLSSVDYSSYCVSGKGPEKSSIVRAETQVPILEHKIPVLLGKARSPIMAGSRGPQVCPWTGNLRQSSCLCLSRE